MTTVFKRIRPNRGGVPYVVFIPLEQCMGMAAVICRACRAQGEWGRVDSHNGL